MNRVIGGMLILLALGCKGRESSSGTETARTAAADVPASSIPLGSYQTDSSVVLGHNVTLELNRDSQATLTRNFSGRPPIESEGTFTAEGANLLVTFPAQDSTGPATFRWRLISSRLVPVEWDRTVYGPAGLTLHHR